MIWPDIVAPLTRRDSWFFWPILVVAFGWCCLLVAGHMRTFTEVSPFDEATHYDYVLSLEDLDFPRLGVPYDDTVLREWSCRGTYLDYALPPCEAASHDYRDYPNQGIQRNRTGPLYYGTVALLVQPAKVFTPTSLGLARSTGALFLFGAAVLTVGACREARIASRGVSWLTVLAFPAAVPSVLHAVSTVNSDAAVLLLGAAMTLAALVYRNRGYQNPWPLVALAAVAGFTKQSAMFPVLLAAAIVTLGQWRSWRWNDVRQAIAVPAMLVLVAGGSLLTWEALTASQALPGYESPIGSGNTVPADGSPADEISVGGFDLIPPVQMGWVDADLGTVLHRPAVLVIQAVALGAVGWQLASRSSIERAYAWALVFAMVATPVLVNLATYASFETYFAVANFRYGLGLVPALWVSVAGFLSAQPGLRRLSVALAALAVWTGLASVF